MFTIEVRNVNEALPQGIALLQRHGRWEDTRAGRALVMPTPVITVYSRPRERVMFSPLRDANPFFHIGEVCWLLAGRRDAAFLDNFVKDFGARFAEPDGTIHDAYGDRWRKAFGFDQLDAVVSQLSDTPGSRQAVVQMWDCSIGDYFEWPQEDLTGDWKTRPCNTHAYLRIRNEIEIVGGSQAHGLGGAHEEPVPYLDITICCRSNDIVWGAYGANAVQFSILQEYLAARLDVDVGTYYQFSNNYHIYEDQLIKLSPPPANRDPSKRLWDDRYTTEVLEPMALVHDAESFDDELLALLTQYETDHRTIKLEEFYNSFLSKTAWPMLLAHRSWRNKDHGAALSWCGAIAAADWRVAATEWVQRRIK